MIIRSPRPANGWTVIDNRTLNDATVSFRARGVLAHILSKPDNWRTSAAKLALHAPEGRDAIRTALNELEAAGYIERRKNRDTAGRWKQELIVYDRPCAKDCGETEPPAPENPAPENQAHYKRLSNNDCENLGDITQDDAWQICAQCNGARYDAETLQACLHCEGQGLM